jgi:hypothetical protein
MVNDGMPFVAIIGGFWVLKDKDPALFEEAKETAREIGAALANAGMGLVVYFSNPESLEPYVVSGYVKTLPAGTGADSIRVRFAEGQTEVKFAEQSTHADLFEPKLFAGKDWEAPFYRSLVDADGVDAVLLMAGDRSTLIAGQIALARPLPVLAVDKFKGAAGIIRTELATVAKDYYPSSKTQTPMQLVSWLKNECVVRAKQQAHARDREKKYLKIISQRDKTYWAGGVFFALLITFFLGLAQAPDPALYPFLTFVGLIAGGATGAFIRSVFWGAEETAPITSLLLGGIAGFVVGMAYLVPQWVGAPGVLTPSATVVQATDKIQFVSAVLVAISAGVGFDTIFTRLKRQAEDLAVGVPGPK